MHPGLCKIFKYIVENSEEDLDLIERAGYYYGQLRDNLEGLRDTFDEMRYAIKDTAVSDVNTDLEFNTLSIVYQQPEESFVRSYEYLLMQRNKDENAKLLSDDDDEEKPDEEGEKIGDGEAQDAKDGEEVDLIGEEVEENKNSEKKEVEPEEKPQVAGNPTILISRTHPIPRSRFRTRS